MEHARSFFGIVAIQNQFIFVFGGMKDHQFLDSIERYDDIVQVWSTIKLKLRTPLAKIGATSLASTGQENKVVIFGGMNKKFVREKHVYIFSSDTTSFTPIDDMQQYRSFNPGSGCHCVAGRYLVVIGGSQSTDGGEMFDLLSLTNTAHLKKNQQLGWLPLPSFDFGTFGFKLDDQEIDQTPIVMQHYTICFLQEVLQ